MANPISTTAYYTLGARAWDASRPKPVCGDSFAKYFMNEEAEAIWQKFKGYTMPNISNASRHAIIDNYLREVLQSTPDATVVIVGAGFDTRAFRISGGRWIELDEPPIVNYKESALPPSKAFNSLTRIPIDFSQESIQQKLFPFGTKKKTHIVIEGVLMYLDSKQRKSLLHALRQIFPDHIVYCDLMRKSFFDRYSKEIHETIRSLGAVFTDMTDYPEGLFLDNGYTTVSRASIPLYAAQYGGLNVPALMLRVFMRTLMNGYNIWRFEYSR
jgi:methyltransferase (TIGR00027 family)